jgi:hypothetical protein
MLQQFIHWFWNSSEDNHENKVVFRRYAAAKIENAYLDYKSRQRLNNQIEKSIINIVQDVKNKQKLSSKKTKKIRIR